MDESALLVCVFGKSQPDSAFYGKKGKLLGRRNFGVGMEERGGSVLNKFYNISKSETQTIFTSTLYETNQTETIPYMVTDTQWVPQHRTA